MKEALDILTKLKYKAHFEKQYNKEAKLDIAINTLKVIMQYE